MPLRFAVLVFALAALAACDRGAEVYEKGAAAEQAGQLEDARWEYNRVVREYPKSEKAAEAQRGYVRATLTLAEQALAAGDTTTCETRLGEVQPRLEDPADKERFQKLMAAQRAAVLAAKQSVAARELAKAIAALAQEEARSQPLIARQAAFKWEGFIVPALAPAQRGFLHLGKDEAGERREFDLGMMTNVGEGKFVLAVIAKATPAAEEAEWYIQNTTNGWRLVCAQKKGAADCQDPWVGKVVKE